MLKNQESCMFFSLDEFAIMLALERTYNLGGEGIFSGPPGIEPYCRSFFLEFRIFLNKMD